MFSSRLASLVVGLGVAVFSLPGCGGSNSNATTDRSAVKSAVKGYLASVSTGDGKRACDLLTAKGRRDLADLVSQQLPEIDPLDCPGTISKLAGVTDETALAASRPRRSAAS